MVNDVLPGKYRQFLFPNHENKNKWNMGFIGNMDQQAAIIYDCKTENDVVSAVTYAKQNGLAISVRMNGEDSKKTDGVIVDLSKMRAVAVDPERGMAEVEAGALVCDVDSEARFYGLATPMENVWKLEAKSLVLGGESSDLKDNYGLPLKSLISVRMVTNDGELLRVSRKKYSDLFWAIGEGNRNLGIITSFAFLLI